LLLHCVHCFIKDKNALFRGRQCGICGGSWRFGDARSEDYVFYRRSCCTRSVAHCISACAFSRWESFKWWCFLTFVQGCLESRGKSGNSIGGRWKTACITRLSNSCCNIVSDQKRDELCWIFIIYYYYYLLLLFIVYYYYLFIYYYYLLLFINFLFIYHYFFT